MAAKTDGKAKLKVTQVKSTISHIARNRATVKALGLRGIGSTSVVTDNDATRGMVRQVRFLVSVEEIAGDPPKSATGRSEDRGDAPASRRSEDSARGRADESEKAQSSDDAVEETT
jgi:large subunit ribosomal protein L30